MNTYTWFKIFNRLEFEALNLVSRTYTKDLTGVGEVDILATKSLTLGITYDGVFLSVNLNDANPFEMDGYAVYMDDADDVYLGILVEEEE